MKKPKMILFDYGQTLVAEERFDGVKGSAEILRHAAQNKYDLTPEQLQQEAGAINRELKRFDPATRAQNVVEIPNHMFTAYLYESLGIRIDLPAEEIDRIFWDAASPGKPTPGIEAFLEFLRANEIRTAVLSNISYGGSVVAQRINRLLPDNHFEFILATSEYLFRKPHPRIFRLALEKEGLNADEVWYVGDNYDCDVAGARSAGITPIWYKGAMDFEQADHQDVIQIHAWHELQEMIEGGDGLDTVSLKPASREDMHTIWEMQIRAFSDLLDKYQDYDMSPAAENFKKVMARYEQPWTSYYYILVGGEKVGAIRIIDKKDGSRKRISPIWIMQEHRNRGYAQEAIRLAEQIHGAENWCLDTILQEKGNLHLYEKMGYHRTGRIDKINERMDIVFYEKD